MERRNAHRSDWFSFSFLFDPSQIQSTATPEIYCVQIDMEDKGIWTFRVSYCINVLYVTVWQLFHQRIPLASFWLSNFTTVTLRTIRLHLEPLHAPLALAIWTIPRHSLPLPRTELTPHSTIHNIVFNEPQLHLLRLSPVKPEQGEGVGLESGGRL